MAVLAAGLLVAPLLLPHALPLPLASRTLALARCVAGGAGRTAASLCMCSGGGRGGETIEAWDYRGVDPGRRCCAGHFTAASGRALTCNILVLLVVFPVSILCGGNGGTPL